MKKVASFEAIREAGPRLKGIWLSEEEDTEDLVEALGGDAYVRGYTAQEWDSFREHKTFDDDGNVVPDETKARFAQLACCVRTGPNGSDGPLFPHSPEGQRVAETFLSPHIFSRLLLISDELSGWRVSWTPFSARRRARGKPTSDGGVSVTSGEPSGS